MKKTWRNVKCILLSERSRHEKGYILYDFSYMTFQKGKTIETIERSMVARGWGSGG